MTIIDSHQHVFWHGRDDAGLIADLDEQGIEQAWLLSWEIPPEEDRARFYPLLNPVHARNDGTHAGIRLADLLTARDHYPDRFIVGYCPPPHHANAADLFEAAYRMYDVRVCGEWKYRMPLDDPRCLDLFRKAGELSCPVVIHLDVPYLVDEETRRPKYQPVWYGGTVANLERAMLACPQTTFIGHAPGFWREISQDADTDPAVYPSSPVRAGGRLYSLFESCANLRADLSAGSALIALNRDSEHARTFCTRFADRLLFGRDQYGPEHLEFLCSLELPAAAMERILFRNARDLVPDGRR